MRAILVRRHALTVALGLVLASAGALAPLPAAGAAAAAPTARAEPVRVVAAFYPLAWVARAVGGPRVHVSDLTPSGAEPHDLELTTDDRDAIADADLAVVMGHGFQPAVESAAGDRDGPTLEVLHHIGRAERAAAHDPHVWLDPVLMRRIVGDVERSLAKVAPARARADARRAQALGTQLAGLDRAYREGLASCRRHLVVTAHAAFGWLARRYGLRQRGIAGVDPEAEPDPRRLGELADLVAKHGVTTIFTEDLVSPKVAQTLAREAGGLKTQVLSPLESLSDTERRRGDDYLDVMRANLAKLRTALACS